MLITILVTLVKMAANTILFAFIPVNLLIGGFNALGLTGFVDQAVLLLGKVNAFFIWLFGHPAWSAFTLTAILTLFGLPIVQLSYSIAHFVKNIKGFVK